MPLLQDQVAIVTGAATGIGRETALLLAAEGATVVLVGRREQPLTELQEVIAGRGGRSAVAAVDISDAAAVAALIEDTKREHGPVDLLVNNAGSASKTLNPQWTPLDEWRGVIDVNLTAVFTLVQAVLPDMLARERGTIITVSSLAAVTPNLLGGAAYGAAKAGVRNFMTFLHATFRGQGLRSVTVLPGETDTPILDNRARPPRPDERANMVQPEDIARAIHLAATLPPRTVMQEVVVAPTRQRDVAEDLEVSRLIGAPEAPDPGARTAAH